MREAIEWDATTKHAGQHSEQQEEEHLPKRAAASFNQDPKTARASVVRRSRRRKYAPYLGRRLWLRRSWGRCGRSSTTWARAAMAASASKPSLRKIAPPRAPPPPRGPERQLLLRCLPPRRPSPPAGSEGPTATQLETPGRQWGAWPTGSRSDANSIAVATAAASAGAPIPPETAFGLSDPGGSFDESRGCVQSVVPSKMR